MLSNAGRFTESFFGTELDPGARLKSRRSLDEPRLRGGGAQGGGGGDWGKGGQGGAAPAARVPATAAPPVTQAPLKTDMDHLAGRALKRAQRAAEHQASKLGQQEIQQQEVLQPKVDMERLAGRALKRAQRAAEHQASKSTMVHGALPEAGRALPPKAKEQSAHGPPAAPLGPPASRPPPLAQ